MAIASLLMAGLLVLAAVGNGMKPPWYGLVLLWLFILSGPFSLLGLRQSDALPVLALCACLYALSVTWLFWKPTPWSKSFFVLLSVLWLLVGCGLASIAI